MLKLHSLSYLFNAVFSPSLVPLRHSNARTYPVLVEAGAYHTASAISSHPGELIDKTLDSQNRAFWFLFNLKTLLRNIEHSPKRGHIKKKILELSATSAWKTLQENLGDGKQREDRGDHLCPLSHKIEEAFDLCKVRETD
ncbi:hypothetical protein RRG08_021277 [Elysia crispata]|uniref:Uncharacterized protein n=1 Tax=Elysia crispata TaxID=231223 RepID=A0AAE1DDP6_9GAST|nr:hypothetical protein RRG08_021277 [Elysia crispata]